MQYKSSSIIKVFHLMVYVKTRNNSFVNFLYLQSCVNCILQLLLGSKKFRIEYHLHLFFNFKGFYQKKTPKYDWLKKKPIKSSYNILLRYISNLKKYLFWSVKNPKVIYTHNPKNCELKWPPIFRSSTAVKVKVVFCSMKLYICMSWHFKWTKKTYGNAR